MQTAHPAVQSLRPSTTIKQLIVRVQAEPHMAEQWATRVIVAFQSACWCVAILLLLSRGVANLHDAKDTSGRQYNIGVGLVVLAGLMVVASPVIVIARAYDRRRYRSVVSTRRLFTHKLTTSSLLVLPSHHAAHPPS